MLVNVFVDEFVLFCKHQELYFAMLDCELDHFLEIILIDNIAARVITEVSHGVEMQPRFDIGKISIRILKISLKILVIFRSRFRERHSSFASVTPYVAGRVRSASLSDRQIHARYHCAELADVCRNIRSFISDLYREIASFFV